jgi:very-short-patch-repair endonuclease
LHERSGLTPDAGVAAVAGRQDGAISLAQLREAGLGKDALARRLGDGRLRRLHRGVYLLGPVAGPWVAEHAALLACGERAVLSNESAAAVWGVRTRPATVDVTIVAGHRRTQPGIRVHHAPVDRDDVAMRCGLRITTPERTLLDLAGRLPRHDLERAANEAQVQRLTTPFELHSYLARSSSNRGATALSRAINHAPMLARSELEHRMLALIRRLGLPEPQTNTRLLGHEVDFVWRTRRLVLETDGYASHSTRRQFEADRRRDAHLLAHGYRVLRFTWWQVDAEPEVVAARLAVALAG